MSFLFPLLFHATPTLILGVKGSREENECDKGSREENECDQNCYENEEVSVTKKKRSSSTPEEDRDVSACSGYFKKVESPKSGGSILQLLDNLVKVGHAMGYKMEGCVKNIEEGNFAFDFVCDPYVGNSGGIICVWDSRMFRKRNHTISDYFVAVKVVIMGDFNEVRSKEERYGSCFNVQGATAFNHFISIGGLVEVPLGGCSFTWCHKSATKMSKLDRFLISEGMLGSCLNISAITLDRLLSDHRPILLREVCLDYGPIPFRFYHYWFELEGFDNFIKETWRESYNSESNAMVRFMNKLKFLKEKIRPWVKNKKESSKHKKISVKGTSSDIDTLIDKGEIDSNLLAKCIDVMKSLQDLEKIDSLEVAQKAKIRCVEVESTNHIFFGCSMVRELCRMLVSWWDVDFSELSSYEE
ncbi:RNA-directed DNA polymerase, eukaryota [Tanacetum coccineum]|uniref:RNA-directed DNA polymerase, eukaryota n=1 Tax=Tanacetum coccineum TaxID=301880 RepID=A0ABQ4XL91_9ASTR